MKTRFSLADYGKDAVDVDVITDPQRVIAMQQACEDVYVDPALRMYMVEVVARTREDPRVLVGSSPRGSQALLKTGRAAAALRGRDFVTPDDIRSVAELAIAHRIILKPEHQIKGLEAGEVMQAFYEKSQYLPFEDIDSNLYRGVLGCGVANQQC